MSATNIILSGERATLARCPDCKGWSFGIGNDGQIVCTTVMGDHGEKMGCGWKGRTTTAEAERLSKEQLPDAVTQNIRDAFAACTSSSVMTCNCGKTYFDAVGGCDWEAGELEKLRADKNAVETDHSIGHVEIEGRVYAENCACWHFRAATIYRFIHSHRAQIAKLFKLEAERLRLLGDTWDMEKAAE